MDEVASRPGRVLICAASTGLLLVSCGSGTSDSGRPSSSAALTIASPANGETVEGSSVTVTVDLQGARIVPQTKNDLAPDEGHLHVLLDGELISMTEGLTQEIDGLEPGPHRIQVEFVASDHAPFDPRVVAIASFVVAT
jgi:hypothetical protein